MNVAMDIAKICFRRWLSGAKRWLQNSVIISMNSLLEQTTSQRLWSHGSGVGGPPIFKPYARSCAVRVENHSGSQILVFGPAASASPGNFLEMQILRPYPWPTESETLVEWGERAEMCFKKTCKWFWCILVWELLSRGIDWFCVNILQKSPRHPLRHPILHQTPVVFFIIPIVSFECS